MNKPAFPAQQGLEKGPPGARHSLAAGMLTHSAAVEHPRARRPPMSIAQSLDAIKQQMQELTGQLDTLVQKAAQDGQPIHDFEREVWKQVLQMGKLYMTQF